MLICEYRDAERDMRSKWARSCSSVMCRCQPKTNSTVRILCTAYHVQFPSSLQSWAPRAGPCSTMATVACTGHLQRQPGMTRRPACSMKGRQTSRPWDSTAMVSQQLHQRLLRVNRFSVGIGLIWEYSNDNCQNPSCVIDVKNKVGLYS